MSPVNTELGINGGVVIEPMVLLIKLLSSLVDVNGKVLVKGFYDNVRPPTEEEEREILQNEIDFEAFKQKLGVESLLAHSSKEILFRQWFQPCLTVHGVNTTPQIKNYTPSSIPNRVEGFISIRTVPDQDGKTLVKLITDHLTLEFNKYIHLTTSYRIEISTHKQGDWWVVDMHSPFYKAAEEAINRTWGVKPMAVREGGTIPVTSYVEKALNTKALLLPMGQSSDSGHLKNERIRLENLYKGKEVFKQIFLNVSSTTKQKK